MKRKSLSRAVFCAVMIAFITIMGLVTTACPDEDNTNPETVNTSALEAKIIEAETAKTGVKTSTDGTNIPSNFKWVTAAEMSTFETAINTAKGVRDTASLQSVVDTAVIVLNTAISAFVAAQEDGTAAALVYTALDTKISEANSAKTGVVINTDAANVNKGTYWVTQAVMDIFNTAITTATNVKSNTILQTEIDAAVTTLNTAITTFNNAKTQGTKEVVTGQGKITINGLNEYDGDMILIFLSDNEDFFYEEQMYIAMGYGSDIINGSATFELIRFNNEPWTAEGEYYLAFYVGTGMDDMVYYYSKARHDFDLNAEPTLQLSDFAKKTYFSITFGEYVEQRNIDFDFSNNTTMDDFFYHMTDNEYNYSEFVNMAEELGFKIGKNSEMNLQYSGADIITSNTVIYSSVPFYSLTFYVERGHVLFRIEGTISLTDIPVNTDLIQIYVQCNSFKYNAVGTLTGTGADRSFSIPVYKTDLIDDSLPATLSNCTFELRVMLKNSNWGNYYISFGNSKNITISNGIADTGNFGTVSLAYVTVSGTVNATINGQPFHIIGIYINSNNGSRSSYYSGSSSNWEVILPKSGVEQQCTIYVRVDTEDNRSYQRSQDIIIPANQGLTGVVLDFGDITS
ncbi:MAG: hypothetical protein FWC19_10780 [Treponema sp.]|nr:hypothetical protein [Treponema sp.]